MRKEMPTNRPGSFLATATYLDLLAFILQQNGYPGGEVLTEARLFDPQLLIIPPPRFGCAQTILAWIPFRNKS